MNAFHLHSHLKAIIDHHRSFDPAIVPAHYNPEPLLALIAEIANDSLRSTCTLLEFKPPYLIHHEHTLRNY